MKILLLILSEANTIAIHASFQIDSHIDIHLHIRDGSEYTNCAKDKNMPQEKLKSSYESSCKERRNCVVADFTV